MTTQAGASLRARLLVAFGAAVLLGVGGWLLRDVEPEAPAAVAAAREAPAAAVSPAASPAAPEPSPAPQVAAEPAPAAATTAAERIALDRPIDDLDPETRALFEARLERERLAEERFRQGVETSQVRARDIDARVQAAFERVELAPELVDGGFMRGLRVRAVHGGSPLDAAGFRVGDLLVRLDGRDLADPAQLPDVLASAGPELSLCALRGEVEFCRDLVLR